MTDVLTLPLLDNLQKHIPSDRAKSAYDSVSNLVQLVCVQYATLLACFHALPDVLCSVDQIQALQARRGMTAQRPTCFCSAV